MPDALKNTFCDPVNLKANKIRILEVGEQAESLCPLYYHGLLQKEALGRVIPALEPSDIQADLSPSAGGHHMDTLTETGKRERQDRQTMPALGHDPWVTTCGDTVIFSREAWCGIARWCPADEGASEEVV